MPKKRLGAEQFVTTLRQVELLQSQPSCGRPSSQQLSPAKPTHAVNENTCTRANTGDKSGTVLPPRRFEARIGCRDIGDRHVQPVHAAGTRLRDDAPDLQGLDLVRFYQRDDGGSTPRLDHIEVKTEIAVPCVGSRQAPHRPPDPSGAAAAT